MPTRPLLCRPLVAPLIALSACGGGGGSAPIAGGNEKPEVAFCRSEILSPHARTEVMRGTLLGLALEKVGSRVGRETGVRIHPGGKLLVFSRERTNNKAASREIYTSSIDGSVAEVRLTADNFMDDSPCWSPDGELILFSSDRGGDRDLWRMAADGNNLQQITGGTEKDRDPDWNPASGRIVFSRESATLDAVRSRLYVMDSQGSGLSQLTDGGTGGGDTEPAFSPDGKTVVFRRLLPGDIPVLMTIDVVSLATKTISIDPGDHRFPRWSPSGDRIFVAHSRPASGFAGLRLHAMETDGSDPIMLFPDKRFDILGFDLAPDLSAYEPPPKALHDSALDKKNSGILTGFRTSGSLTSIEIKDGAPLKIGTVIYKDRDIAGLLVRVKLPADKHEEIADIHVECTASLSRIDGDSTLRITLKNPGTGRSDTVLEIQPSTTEFTTHTFRIASLAHIDRDLNLRLEVIGDLPQGSQAELFIDHVRVRVRKKSGS